MSVRLSFTALLTMSGFWRRILYGAEGPTSGYGVEPGLNVVYVDWVIYSRRVNRGGCRL